MTELRPVPTTDREACQRMLQYAFAPERGPVLSETDDDWPPSLFDQRGLYDGDSLRAVCKLYYHDTTVRGEAVTVGGLGAVATPPEHRGQGYAADLCRHALHEYREAAVTFVTLWPFSTPFYRRLGWGTANTYRRFDLPPSALPDYDTAGQFVPLDADGWERLRRVETAAAAGTALSLRRSEAWWRKRTLADWDDGGSPYCYGYECDGELRGYVVYTVADDADNTLSVSNFAAADEEARRALFAFLGNHGAQIQRVTLQLPPDAALLHRVDDPGAVDCTVEAGPMVRLTDVRHLERLDWPDGDLDCLLSVSDPLLDRNDGLFELSVSGGTATVDPLPASDSAADVTVDIATLSQLAVGTHGVDAADRLAGLEILDDSVRKPLADVFRPESVYLDEFF
ncbi:GNAT family N-acetyltransferase [Haloarcula sp. CBA1130]|uniref:GNAT family N-acetyltransferase n=1 Tax=unclassified Haloarcula TaxID=2624677 RepID=UPI001245A1FC|nr:MULTISPECIES: GNAT family N-acetyltransferase [unclassified Haloarcula]KAA9396784.1 GNAT family N-acetyltransferase [Haloarcula sp. CBA1129]KAA9401745.1 GNAT family N-acetyltransferase [Haloarcula sp. CBA1130]